MRSRICSSSLLGCQPTLSQLTEIWELTLYGLESAERKVSLTHLVGDRERVVSQDLKELVREAGSPDVLNNLTLSAEQENPHREVLIQIGPGRDTSVTIEAQDETWAIGRHTQVMEKLNDTRRWYTPGEPVKLLSWPEKSKARPLTLKRAILGLVGIVLAVAGALLLVVLVEVYLAIAIVPTYNLVRAISHHQAIYFGGVLLEIISITVVCATLYGLIIVILSSKSKVVIKHKKFWDKGRIALVGTLAGVIAAIASVLALVK
jgi:hypothetical protein